MTLMSDNVPIKEEEEVPPDVQEVIDNMRNKDKTYTYTDEKTGKTKTVRRKWTNKTDRQLRNSQLLQFLEDNHEFLHRTPPPSYAQIAEKFNKEMNFENPVSVSAVYKCASQYCSAHQIERKKKVRKSE